MKVLSKIKRRADGDELPKRGHLVEMELYDTDRNPLEFPSGDGRTTYIDLAKSVALPFDPIVGDGSWGSELASIDFSLANPCYAVIYGGAVFDVASGAGAGKALNLSAQIESAGSVADGINFSTQGTFLTNAAGYRTQGYNGFYAGLLNPADYTFAMWCYKTDDTFAATVRQLGVSVVLFPANGKALSSLGGVAV